MVIYIIVDNRAIRTAVADILYVSRIMDVGHAASYSFNATSFDFQTHGRRVGKKEHIIIL